MKLKAGKVAPVVPDNKMLSEWYAVRKLSKDKNSTGWKLAAAAAANKFLLIGKLQR